jgi:hypothetical protein
VSRGSHLIVESLDRLSRDLVLRALGVFSELLEAGIIIHTTTDGKVYDWKSVNGNTSDLIISITIMIRANEESSMKAYRQLQTWERKRSDAKMLKLTSRCPTWLELAPDRKSFRVRDRCTETVSRTAIIVRIFTETANGIGCDKIARRLNAEGIRPFAHGRLWHGGSVRAYLENRAVLGEYQPGKTEVYDDDGVRQTRRVPAGDPIPDYYPRIVWDELWHRAWASIDTRRNKTGVANAGGRRGTKLTNLFGQLAICARCRGVLNVRDRGAGRRSPAFLQCSNFRNGGGCTNSRQYAVAPLEHAILTYIEEINLHEAAPVELRLLETSVAVQRERADKLRDRIDELLEMAADGLKSARAKAQAEEGVLESLKADIAEAENRLANLRGAVPLLERQAVVAALREQLHDEGADIYAIRARLRQSLREIITYLTLFPNGEVIVCVQQGAVGYFFQDTKLVRRIEWPLGQDPLPNGAPAPLLSRPVPLSITPKRYNHG